MNGQHQMDDLVGRGYPYYDLVGRPAYPADAMGQCGIPGGPLGVGPALGYPVLGCPPLGYPTAGLPVQAMGGMGMAPGMPMAPADAVAGPFPAGVPFGGPGLLDPWGCFGGPVNPLVVQQVEQPARFLRPRCPQGIRAEPIGFGCVCIGPCEEATLTCCVSDITKIKELVIPSSIAYQLLVTDITVGRECFLQCGPIPAALFVENSEIGDFDFPTANENDCISITLKNISDAEVEACVGARALTLWY